MFQTVECRVEGQCHQKRRLYILFGFVRGIGKGLSLSNHDTSLDGLKPPGRCGTYVNLLRDGK